MFNEGYSNAPQTQLMAKEAAAGSYQPPTTRQTLEHQKFLLEMQLKKVLTALQTLDEHPEMEQFMETIKAAQR